MYQPLIKFHPYPAIITQVLLIFAFKLLRNHDGISDGIQPYGAGDRRRYVSDHRSVPPLRNQGRILLRRALLVVFPVDGRRGDRGVGRRAAYPLVHPAGRLGRVVALVDRRAVRAARTCGEGMVPGQSEPEEEIGRCACLPPSRS